MAKVNRVNPTSCGLYEARAIDCAVALSGAWIPVPGNCDGLSGMISCTGAAELTLDVTNAETLDASTLYAEWSSGVATGGATVTGFFNTPITAIRYRIKTGVALQTGTVQLAFLKRRPI